MSNIIPLPISRGSLASSKLTEGEVARGNDEGDNKLEKETGQNDIDEFVDFMLKKGDKDEITNFQHYLSDFSRHKGHAFDSQLERIDKWQIREKIRNDEMCDAIKDILQKPDFNVQGDYYDIHDNKI